jgi:ABC-2 type transport system permease protein
MTTRAAARRGPTWPVVTRQELRDLWVGGRGLVLTLGFSVLIGLIAYLSATNQAINFLEQREAVSLTLQVGIAVGSLLALLGAADTVSGERERGTLETLLLTPVSRLGLCGGKLLAALSLWVAAFCVTAPFVWFLGRGLGVVWQALLSGVVVGTLLAVFVASLGVVISVLSSSNRVSLSLSLFVLLALFAPTQLPPGAQKGWLGDLLIQANPFAAGLRYVDRIIVRGYSWTHEATLLIAPIVGAVAFAAIAAFVGAHFIQLRGGGRE